MFWPFKRKPEPRLSTDAINLLCQMDGSAFFSIREQDHERLVLADMLERGGYCYRGGLSGQTWRLTDKGRKAMSQDSEAAHQETVRRARAALGR